MNDQELRQWALTTALDNAGAVFEDIDTPTEDAVMNLAARIYGFLTAAHPAGEPKQDSIIGPVPWPIGVTPTDKFEGRVEGYATTNAAEPVANRHPVTLGMAQAGVCELVREYPSLAIDISTPAATKLVEAIYCAMHSKKLEQMAAGQTYGLNAGSPLDAQG